MISYELIAFKALEFSSAHTRLSEWLCVRKYSTYIAQN